MVVVDSPNNKDLGRSVSSGTFPDTAPDNGADSGADTRVYKQTNKQRMEEGRKPTTKTKGYSRRNDGVKRQWVTHSKKQVSDYDLLRIRKEMVALYNILVELPRVLCDVRANGVYLRPKFYRGIRRDPRWLVKYFNRRETFQRFASNIKPLSADVMKVLTVLATWGEFITYDRLLEELKDYRNDWKDLQPQIVKLSNYPQMSREEEKQQSEKKEPIKQMAQCLCGAKFDNRILLYQHWDDVPHDSRGNVIDGEPSKIENHNKEPSPILDKEGVKETGK